MAAIITATVKSGNTSFKTANMTVENVTRNASVNLAIKNAAGTLIGGVKRGVVAYLHISSSSGLIKGDQLKASVVSLAVDGDGEDEVDLSVINYVNGTECIWSFVIPTGWKGGTATLRIQHMNYHQRVIGTVYCSVFA